GAGPTTQPLDTCWRPRWWVPTPRSRNSVLRSWARTDRSPPSFPTDSLGGRPGLVQVPPTPTVPSPSSPFCRVPNPFAPQCHPSPPCREQLGRCCNASANLVLSRDNTPLGSRIVCDGQPAKKLLVREELSPPSQGSPFQGVPYDSCAVVGNGGILRNSSCGPEIDRAQFVISGSGGRAVPGRRLTGASLPARRFRGLGRWRRPFAEAVGAYGAALLLVPAFSFAAYTAVSFQALYTLEDFGSPARTLFMNPEYLARLDGHWRSHGLRPNRLSSGFMLVSSALEMCRHLTLYGFWPFPSDPEGRPLPHHYYDNQPPRSGVHAMPEEFTRYLGMHLQGALKPELGSTAMRFRKRKRLGGSFHLPSSH
uniref:Uncharacterized protein n=1 Tax=Chelonoidis abingdonii TaxID=106734 RepID=A0A8C0GZF5_CHEAB